MHVLPGHTVRPVRTAPARGTDASVLAVPARRVEARLQALLDEQARVWCRRQAGLAPLFDALSEFVAAGGKRLRPLFCFWAAAGAGADPNDPGLVDVASALELLHAFALIHDDVMDGSAYRRGRPTMHRRFEAQHAGEHLDGERRRFGEGLAVLAGDLAFALADGLIRDVPHGVRDVWNDLRVELTMGQWIDITAAARRDRSPEVARWVASYKSGRYTVQRPLQLGAVFAGRPDLVDAYGAFGRPLGEAFQLRDDLLGVVGDPGCTGKPVGSDLRDGKATLLLAFALRLADGRGRRQAGAGRGRRSRRRRDRRHPGGHRGVGRRRRRGEGDRRPRRRGRRRPRRLRPPAAGRGRAAPPVRAGGVAAAVSRRAVVVGAGLGGLAAACHLAGRGWQVDVIERDDGPGGRAGRFERAGFRFDTGPTVLTMPDLLAATFEAAGADMADFVTLRRLDPAYRACFADGSELLVRSDRDAMVEEVRRVCGPGAADAFVRYCRWLGELYAVELGSFLARNYDGPADLLRPVGPALRLLRLGGLGRLDGRVRRTFADGRLRRLFSFQALYAGVAPQQALALLAVISYMDVVAGVWFPDGGIHAVASGLTAAAEKAGVAFRFATPVERIVLSGGSEGAVRGVMAGGELVGADVVVCNADLPGAYSLVPGLRPPPRLRRPHFSPSALVWHAGVRGTPGPCLAHHNIHFGAAWRSSFRSVIDDGVRMPDPSVLVSVPSLTDPALAPDGASVLYALEPVPNLAGAVDWARDRPGAEERFRARLDAWGYPVEEVVTSALVDPVDWARAGLAAGTPFSMAHRFLQSGPFRAANVERRAPGLVFAGCGTVPGVGVPMVLLSGRLAADRAAEAVTA